MKVTEEVRLFQIMGNQKGKPVLRDEDISTLTKSSGMTEEQIKESYEKFVKDHPKGDFQSKNINLY